MEMSMMVDVHESKPPVKVSVSRVGIVNFKRPIQLIFNGSKVTAVTTINIFVDIPRTKKGAHISRNIEAIDEIFENGELEVDADRFTDYAVKLAKKLSQKHDYTNHIEVELETELPVEKKAPKSHIKSYSIVRVSAGSEIYKENGENEKIFKTISVELEGMTVCPNSYKMTMDYAREKLKEKGFSEDQIEVILNTVPLSAHNQRGTGRIKIKSKKDVKIKISEIVSVIEESMSSPVYPILKRVDEQYMVIYAHFNPRFTEDVVRHMVGLLVKKYGNKIPDDAFIIASQQNYESIHAHDVYSEIKGYFRDLKAEILL